MEMSRLFNFDDFDAQVEEALAENERVMHLKSPNPGEIGGVVCTPLFKEWIDGPEDAA
jgi:hypothetical protein